MPHNKKTTNSIRQVSIKFKEHKGRIIPVSDLLKSFQTLAQAERWCFNLIVQKRNRKSESESNPHLSFWQYFLFIQFKGSTYSSTHNWGLFPWVKGIFSWQFSCKLLQMYIKHQRLAVCCAHAASGFYLDAQ